MYIREKTSPNTHRIAVQVVISVRDGSRVRQRILRHFGMAETDEELHVLRQLATQYIYEETERKDPSMFEPEQQIDAIQEVGRPLAAPDDSIRLNQVEAEVHLIVGFHDIYGKLYDELGFNQVFDPVRMRAGAHPLKQVVLSRLSQPPSQREQATLTTRFGGEMTRSAIYLMMANLNPKRIDKIKSLATSAAKWLSPNPVDVLLFDCTTLYFESYEDEELGPYGVRQDHMDHETQKAVLALVVTQEGLPLTYELTPVSTDEESILKTTLAQLKQRFSVRHATVVADRGMLSRDSRKALLDEGFHYIIGARLEQMHPIDQEFILDFRPRETEGVNFIINDERLVVSQSLKDEEQIAAANGLDGLLGIYTSLPTTEFTAEKVLSLYQGMWQVEAAFRVTQHDQQVRPMPHWTPEGIQAHVAIAFMCLTCVRQLIYRTRIQQRQNLSEEQIRRTLNRSQVTIVRLKGKKERYAIPLPLPQYAEQLYKVMNLPRHTDPFVYPKNDPPLFYQN